MQTQNIRRKFIEYFKNQNHTVVPSASVVPHDDPTLLFNNAGMNQFKDVFLGKSVRDYKRAVSSQKCLRVGGKHNDLENVGHTRRHCTFFEMLGNFSFGDYFKADAIKFAWEVSTEVFGFAPGRLWPSVFREDDEAFELWTKYVPAEKIVRFDEKENFWAMGDTGPCGPCSEILYDRGAEYGSAVHPYEDPEGERFLEFWNLVFMQYNRDASGQSSPLPKPSIDTGAGIERIVMLLMGVDSVFETDIFRELIAQVETISGIEYHYDHPQAAAFRVIADHLRTLAFAIADGVQPSNLDRGYVLRKVLRRAVRYGRTIGLNKPFLADVLPRLITTMGDDYKELHSAKNRIAEILTIEEEAFIKTLQRGGNILNNIVDHAQKHNKTISGDDAFKLKDTYGFPLEEIMLIAKDTNLHVDNERYEQLEKEAKERSRQAHKATRQEVEENLFANQDHKSSFVGYDEDSTESTVTAIVVDNKLVDTLNEGQEGMVVLEKTPFYAEKGGQIGDHGIIQNQDVCFVVDDCQTPFTDIIGHCGRLNSGTLHVGDVVTATLNDDRRQQIANNHTATHLLHWALHEVLGEHVKQAGSIVEPDRLRFDFSHHKAMTTEEITEVEDLVNEKIRANTPVSTYEQAYDSIDADIKQFFGDKYGSKVRIVDIEYSKELCGGTHTTTTGTIGFFRIAKEGSIAAGIRRIEGVTGHDAELLARHSDETIQEIAAQLKCPEQKVLDRIQKLNEENKDLAQQLKKIQKQQQKGLAERLISQKENLDSFELLAVQVEVGGKELKNLTDTLSKGIPSGVIVIAAKTASDKCQVVVKVTDDVITKNNIKANDLIKELAPIIGGGGGGKAQQAQAGGTKPENLPEIITKAKTIIGSLCSG